MLEVEPELKQRLYSALALDGKTMKEWFIVTRRRLHSVTTAAEHVRFYEAKDKSNEFHRKRERAEAPGWLLHAA